ncbi:HAD family hydrolase [Pseudomonadota bacterium]
MIKDRILVIFDFDETLIFGIDDAWNKALEVVFGEKIEEIIHRFRKFREYRNVVSYPFIQWLKEEEYNEEKGMQFYNEFRRLKKLIKLPDTTIPLLESLNKSKNVDLVLLSLRDGESVKDDVKRYQLSSYFVGVYGNDSLGGLTKPNPDAVHMAAEYASEKIFNSEGKKRKSSPGNRMFCYNKIYFVGDSVDFDMGCASQVEGCQPIFLFGGELDEKWEKSLRDVFERESSKIEYSTIAHVKDHIELKNYFVKERIIFR